ncbi:MAG TPA: hypothetical protein VNW06_11575 [Cytophagaceae bacterium]|jgi:hypothetical protein|nr:hypothetical protein [Cytophagaceae bacterium]
MESNSTIKEEFNKKMNNLKRGINTILSEHNFKETEEDLNLKILQITMEIKDKYPELSKYIEEMEETIPYEQDPEINTKSLKSYYDSLNSMLNKYILEHPDNIDKN